MSDTQTAYRTNGNVARAIPLKELDPRIQLLLQALRRCFGILSDALKQIEDMR